MGPQRNGQSECQLYCSHKETDTIIQLGHPNKVDAVGPRRVFGDLTHRAVIDLAVGKDHMICLDDMGKVFGW